jgi:uncharacterized membrane protein YciS (DUF1049 family)
MSQTPPQSFENHTRIVPAYFGAFFLIAANLLWQLYSTAVGFSVSQLMALFVAVALMIVYLYARVFALTVQDRVIRLETQLRLMKLAPDLEPRLSEFTVNQLCSLRFAGDAELPALARKVLSEKLDDRKAIKRQITDWQPDHLRA